jgi:hypothetical protein
MIMCENLKPFPSRERLPEIVSKCLPFFFVESKGFPAIILARTM